MFSNPAKGIGFSELLSVTLGFSSVTLHAYNLLFSDFTNIIIDTQRYFWNLGNSFLWSNSLQCFHKNAIA